MKEIDLNSSVSAVCLISFNCTFHAKSSALSERKGEADGNGICVVDSNRNRLVFLLMAEQLSHSLIGRLSLLPRQLDAVSVTITPIMMVLNDSKQ